ncbi:FtsX-like permease family protein [Gulosibacter sp. 10]|uniref:FtsX-like permease family protein n=1 Tax=Gulosibacter sp. 10 TaxID=1255570 RepID=UPI00097EDFFC|nr:FtsX-like permease family protein [Gulosibacter sp. 10]SJM62547.1 hypothetical protein FM112_08580 [Gulosibacter sp. 10]
MSLTTPSATSADAADGAAPEPRSDVDLAALARDTAQVASSGSGHGGPALGIRLAWQLAKPSRSGLSALLLPVVAFTITAALVLTVLAGVRWFWQLDTENGPFLAMLSVLALVLLAIPLMGLAGSAARLSLRRRDDRLATLRLLGGTGGLVRGITLFESTALALVGTLLGVAVYFALIPLVGLLHFDGGPIGAGGLVLPLPWILVVVLAVVLMALASAALSLGKVLVTPLGVRTRQRAPELSWIRVAIGAVALIACVIFTTLNPASAGGTDLLMVAAIFAVPFAIMLIVLNLVGPWLIRTLTRMSLKRAKSGPQLISARSILEDPKQVWRQVSGVAVTSFVAVIAGSGMAIAGSVESGEGASAAEMTINQDIQTGVLLTLMISFLLTACSAGLTQAAAILDRQDLWVGLHRIGMAVGTMDGIRRRQMLAPLLQVSITAIVVAAALTLPLVGAAIMMDPLSIGVIVVTWIIGVLLTVLAGIAAGGVLRSVLRAQNDLD